MRFPLLAVGLAAAFTLAGCVAPSDDATGTSASDPTPETYTIPVMAAHAVVGMERTVRIQVLEGGEETAAKTYSTSGKAQESPETVLTVQATGPIQVRVYDGDELANVKTIDPTTCVDPDVQIHLTNDAAHVFSSCD